MISTITNSRKEITPPTLKALIEIQEAGKKVVLASGRPTYGVVPLARQLHLERYGSYILSFNGARITDCRTGQVIYNKTLPQDVIPDIYRIASNYPVDILAYEDGQLLSGFTPTKYSELESRINHLPIVQIDNFREKVSTFPNNKFLLTGEPDSIAAAKEEMSAHFHGYIDVYCSDPFFLEIVPKNVDKAASLLKLLTSIGLTADEMICCGDGYNDLTMIETAGLGVAMENAQPLVLNYVKGTLALAHNGNLINAMELRKDLEYTGAIFQTTIDSEVIAYHIARERLKSKTVEEAVGRACRKLKGAYSLVVMSPRKLIGARDPFGFKPLCIGKRDNAYILASESCALETIGADFVRDVLPGEVVTITPENGIQSDLSMALPKEQEARCIFEYIYFARPDSRIDNVSVYASRIKAGRFLAMDSAVDADLVVGVPESGNAAALGYSLQSGIPYGTAFVKNGYVGRTFIKPKQSSRESSVRVKLNVLKEAVNGKRIIMIDDSIVRGTTSDRIVKMLRDAGATEVHVRISSPPFLWPCYFGTDIPEREQLIAYNRSIEEIRDIIGADTLGYLKVERLHEMVEGLNICEGCFTGKYPLEPPKEDIRGDFER